MDIFNLTPDQTKYITYGLLLAIIAYLMYQLNSKDFFVVMETFGVPKEVPAELTTGPFGVFTSSKTAVSGTVTLEGTNIYLYSGSSWTKLDSGKSSNTGIFIGTN